MTRRELRVVVLVSAAHALNHGFIKLLPSLNDPIAAETGADLGALGRVASLQNLAYGVPALLAGWIAGRLGAGRLVRAYLFLASASCALVLVPGGLPALAGALFLLGFSCSLYHPAGLAIASRASRAGMAMAVHGIFGNVGHILAPIAAAALIGVSALSWRLPYLALGVLGLLLGLFTFRAIPADGRFPRAEGDDPSAAPPLLPGDPTRWVALSLTCLVFFLQAVSYYAFDTFITVHLADRLGAVTPEEAARAGGIATAVAFAIGIGGQAAGGYLVHRFRMEGLYVACLASGVPFLLLLAPAAGAASVAAASLYAFTYFMAQPVGNLLVARYTSDRDRATGYGLQFLANFGLGGMTASLSGEVADRFGTGGLFLAAAGLLSVTALLALPLLRRAGRAAGAR